MMTDTSSVAPTTKRRRLPYWDNARFAAVTLVVMGHATQRLIYDNDSGLILYLFIYSFHIPAFAIISGYFTRSAPPTRKSMLRIVTDILIPYLIFETIWAVVQFLVEGTFSFNPSKPSWTLWFLLALAIFRVALPFLALLRWPLLISIALSVGVGFFDNVDSTFSLSRAIGTLPFFVLGWKCSQWRVGDRWIAMRQKAWPWRIVAVAILGAWVTVLTLYIDLWRAMDLRFWFFYDDSYQGLGEPHWWSGLLRLGLIALAVLLSACFFSLVPRRHTWFTALGSATMYVYLLHSFVLYPLRESGVLLGDYSILELAVVIVGSVLLAAALASPLSRHIFRPLVEPKVPWLLARRHPPA
jgi:fucose 4-O-acetylase-like acetyltransferase